MVVGLEVELGSQGISQKWGLTAPRVIQRVGGHGRAGPSAILVARGDCSVLSQKQPMGPQPLQKALSWLDRKPGGRTPTRPFS